MRQKARERQKPTGITDREVRQKDKTERQNRKTRKDRKLGKQKI